MALLLLFESLTLRKMRVKSALCNVLEIVHVVKQRCRPLCQFGQIACALSVLISANGLLTRVLHSRMVLI